MSTSTTGPAAAPAGHPAVDDFLAVICADEQLLRAEFDAIVAANWPAPDGESAPPTKPPAGGPPDGDSYRTRQAAGPRRRFVTGRPERVATDGPARQRSPPPASTRSHQAR